MAENATAVTFLWTTIASAAISTGTEANSSHTSHHVVWTRENAPFLERVIIGGAYLFLSLLFLVLQISILIIFLSYKEYRKNACYRCVIVISIADTLQLCIHCYGSIITLYDNSFSPLFEKVLGGLCNAICISLLPLGTVLALNRLLIFLGYGEGSANDRYYLFDVLLGASCAWGAIFFVFYMTPECGMAFRNYAWTYDLTLPWSEPVELIDSLTTIPMIIAPLIFYLIIFSIVAVNRSSIHKMRTKNTNGKIVDCGKTADKKLLAPQELRLLAQCVIFFACEASLLTVWHMQSQLFPDSPYTTAVINYYWVFYNGINPLLYMCLNRFDFATS